MRLPALLLLAAFAAAAQSQDADDLVWQKAVSKFDARRSRILEDVAKGDRSGPFQPNWDSLQNYQVPRWYLDAKFGIFLHWGVYSVPAFGSEWYPRNMYREGSDEFKHHVATYGPQSKFGYKDFIPNFRAEKFDPKAWAELFRAAGVKYVIPVAEHHDGFAMYSTDLNDWCAAKMGPHRDIVGELAKAVRAAGLHFGVSTHRAEHYFFMNGGRAIESDVQDPRFAAFYGPAHAGVSDEDSRTAHPDAAYLNDWLARTAELVEKYHPEVVWFDWWIENKEFEQYRQRFAAFYYNDAVRRASTAVINYKHDAYPPTAAVLDIERGQLDQAQAQFWQTDTSVSIQSWGYIENDSFRSAESLIHELVDIVSKNGCLLLNLGPKPDGTIAEPEQKILRDMGRWLSTNAEAIYGTRPWKIYGEGPTKVVGGSFHDTDTQPYSSRDIRFTAKGDVLYAIALGWPENGRVTIQSLAESSDSRKIRKVELLGHSTPVKFTRDANGLEVQLPSTKTGEYAWVLRIE